MNYVAQKGKLDCLIAATAMVLDLTYDEVARVVPVPSWGDLQTAQQTGTNPIGQSLQEAIEKLALERRQQVVELYRSGEERNAFPFTDGCRRIVQISGPLRCLGHSLAVEETGIAFDPDGNYENIRKHWSEYDVRSMLEFRPL